MKTANRRRFLGLAAAAGAGAVLPLGGRPASASSLPDPTVWREFGTPLVPATGHGPLSGLNVAVKDLFAVQGHRVGAGNPVWLAESRPQATTAAAVAALLAAGADVVGLARTDEFAYSLAGTNGHYGTPPNPAAPDRISGGSTSGPASAVALGQADIGLGTDTGGSIRIPSSYQGLYGIRPSHGAIDTTGLLPLAPSFDTVGWIARDADTLRAAGRVLLPRATGPAPSAAVFSQEIVDVADTEVSASVRRALAGWRGAADLPHLGTVRFDAGVLPGWVRAFQTKQGVEAWQHLGPWVSRHWDSLNPDVRSRFEAASRYTPADLAAAERVLREARTRVDDLLGDRILLLPSASSVAPTRKEAAIGGPAIEQTRAQTFQLTCLAGLSGRCAVSVPIRSRTAPVGLCLVGPQGSDRHVLDLAARVSAAL
ncbi:amidase [Streptomyces aculeolatus]|uniref:amidase family protein n=1 Tax=Streptomyces aculeolatus TaxID=270689 RepID=UPI001CEC7DB0|nr:amidase family protein [Streptomyces aculeolatus]